MSFTGFILPGPESSGGLSLHLVLVDLYFLIWKFLKHFFFIKSLLDMKVVEE